MIVDLCAHCILECDRPSTEVRVDLISSDTIGVRGAHVDTFRDVTGLAVDEPEKGTRAHRQVPAGLPAVRWLAECARVGTEAWVNGQTYRPRAITTVDGLPLCEAHALAYLSVRQRVRRR